MTEERRGNFFKKIIRAGHGSAAGKGACCQGRKLSQIPRTEPQERVNASQESSDFTDLPWLTRHSPDTQNKQMIGKLKEKLEEG